MFINIHTHREVFDAKVEIVNLNPSDSAGPNFYSRGLHPWKVSGDYREELEALRLTARERRCIAIGECGLDRVCETDFELQTKAFDEQIELANELGKPLIIHCVKAFNELTAALKKKDNSVPVIIHGFNNNFNIADSLLKEGFLLSFGKGLLTHGGNAAEVLRNTGKNKFFLETDTSDLSIKYIYKKAAEILGIDEEILKAQMKRNYQNIFKEEIL